MKIGLMVGREYSFPHAFIDRVNEIGRPHGISAEFVKLGRDEVRRAAGLQASSSTASRTRSSTTAATSSTRRMNGTYVINNPFWWTADDKFFNYALMSRLGVAIPKTVLLPQKAYPPDVDILPASLRNLEYPIDWDGLLALRRPAGHPEAVFGRRLEARLQGGHAARS